MATNGFLAGTILRAAPSKCERVPCVAAADFYETGLPGRVSVGPKLPSNLPFKRR